MGCKMINLILGLIFVVLLSVPGTIQAAAGNGGFTYCESTVKNWAFSSIDSEVKDDNHALRDLLFFLHVPRTGGRTYYHCFLKKMYAGSQECPRSYDKLRFNPRKPKCRLLSTHDDYSMMSKLPKEKTSVVTILRNPVDRVFSTYEFSVEVAARFLIHPNLTSVARMGHRMIRKSNGISTLDIWPWKYLVPWMREDLFARRDARKLRGQNHLVTNNPYDMEDMLIPLHDYINDPIAHDVVHNGATFQITGLTNNSCSAQAHEVRRCVLKYRTLGEYVLKVAKRRLDEMLYVGLTENHKESATMFGKIVASQVISQHSSTKENDASSNDSEQSSLPNKKSVVNGQTLQNDSSAEMDEAQNGNVGPKNSNSISYLILNHSYLICNILALSLCLQLYQLTVGKLMEAYESCISSLRNTQSQRRVNSLKRISPANFTKEARLQVPDELIQEIKSLNRLDVELYKHAQHIFKRQQAHMMQHMVYDGSIIPTFSTSSYSSFYDSLTLKLLCIAGGGVPLLLIILYIVNVKLRRSSSKVKL